MAFVNRYSTPGTKAPCYDVHGQIKHGSCPLLRKKKILVPNITLRIGKVKYLEERILGSMTGRRS